MERCDLLARCSEEPDRLTRRFATVALREAIDSVAVWMRATGMSVRRDYIGNLIGRYEAGQVGAPTLLLGSHLDTVRDAGKYDGPLGVLVALAAVERLHREQRRLPFAIEVLAFADEEGVRYHTSYLGSQVVAGTFEPDNLRLVDADGIAMADAIRAFGGDPERLQDGGRAAGDLIGYCEVHIEQGPVLEARNLPVAVVSAISGQSRLAVGFAGEAGHAGTVPMELRRDALCAAAELVLAVERTARDEPGLVATVGQFDVRPGASNVIPGEVALTLDVRHEDDDVRSRAIATLHATAEQIVAARGLRLRWQLVQEHATTRCDPGLSGRLSGAVAALGYAPLRLPSGAGHDAVVLAEVTRAAMLFVRCKGGISHHPDESVDPADVAVAIAALDCFLDHLADKPGDLNVKHDTGSI
jgi:allantoate deiminase